MNRSLVFSTSTEFLRVSPDAVAYIKADGNYSTITTADGTDYLIAMQLGQMEQKIAVMLASDDNRFIRIGKSLIVNSDFITFINPPRQRMILSDNRSFRREVSASKEALKTLKELLEKEATQ